MPKIFLITLVSALIGIQSFSQDSDEVVVEEDETTSVVEEDRINSEIDSAKNFDYFDIENSEFQGDFNLNHQDEDPFWNQEYPEVELDEVPLDEYSRD
jgi:hypothetical protein